MSNQRRNLDRLALVAFSASLASFACSDSRSNQPTAGGGGDAGTGGSSAGSSGAAGMGGSGPSGGRGGVGGSGGAAGGEGGAAATGGTGEPPDAGVSDGGDAGPVGDAATPFLYDLIDFAGASSTSEIKTVETWDIREKFTFGVTGSHTSSATVEVVDSQAQLTFASDDPDPLGTTDVFQFVKIPAASGDGLNWGGWAHIIFDLGSALPEDMVLALPQWNNTNQVMVPGSKVIQVDVYYDDTVDPDFDWETLLALEGDAGPDIYNSEAAQGYNINLSLVNYAAHANTAGAQDSGGFYIGYSAYLTQPNTWMTLTFTAADEGRATNFYSAGSGLAALPSQVTGVDIKPAGGYEDEDENPVYLRNLRIVDAP